MLEGAAQPSSSSAVATVIGLITFFLGATGAFLELQTALNAIWRVKPKAEPASGDAVQRLISFGLVVGVGFLLLVSLLVSAGLAALDTYMGNAFPGARGPVAGGERAGLARRGHAALRHDLQVPARRGAALARRVGRRRW